MARWAADDLTRDDPGRLRLADAGWRVEGHIASEAVLAYRAAPDRRLIAE